MIVVYDGSFEGFLTLVYEFYYAHLRPTTIEKKAPSSLLLEELVQIQTDDEKATKVLAALKSKLSKKNFETILTIFMCDSRAFELDLLSYIILGFRDQKQLANINHSAIFNIHNLQKEYSSLAHRMYGFVRFEELEDGSLYARVETKFNILYPLAKHFSKRLNNQSFIIHDIPRALAFIHSEEFIGIREIVGFEEPIVSRDEEKFSRLWKHFFESVAIESRTNPKLQRQLVPLIYRTYMSEFSL